MALITLETSVEYDYIPEFDRKNSVDPLVVKITFMNHKEHIDFISKLSREMSTTDDPEKQTQISKAHDRKKFIEHVKGFENWNKADGTPEPNDAGLFYDRNESNLIYEISSAFREKGRLTEGQRKN
jgi:hypothetical protein